MEVYTLDTTFRPKVQIDFFDSLIWTERCRAFGDFEMVVKATRANRSLFTTGTRFGSDSSYRVMTLETVEDTVDSDGKSVLKLSGRSLEAILLDRIARPTFNDLTTTPKYVVTGLPKDIATNLFRDICVTGALNTGDIISGVTLGSIFPADTIGAPSTSITIEFEPMTLYDAEVQLCDLYGMGFRLVRHPTTYGLYFDVYMGRNLTTQQNDLPPVIFAPNLDNLQNTNELKSIAPYKNVAYVFSAVGHQIVYSDDVSPVISGLDRRVLLVNASDITDTDPAVAATKMTARGYQELAKNRKVNAFDGEVNQYGSYKYGVDYNLGDLVEKRNSDGLTNQMQITEQIFVTDAEGARSYPTLSLNLAITPGSWNSWDYNQVWADLNSSTTHWADQP